MRLDSCKAMPANLRLGANLGDKSCSFLVWCPNSAALTLTLHNPQPAYFGMHRADKGFFWCDLEKISPEALYSYRFENGTERPDPASKSQPQGVHGPSEVCSESFPWADSKWRGLPLREMMIYEVHVGTFTPNGSFEAIIPRLPDLKSLGVTTLELMPIAQFPGDRNWGYDGVYPYAVQNSYGGRKDLKKLVNACHAIGMAVALDVVYNHLGPEGNYLSDFGPYFTDAYKTPWGQAVNFDGPGSDEVRQYFIENAVYWLSEFHIDALRLDAIHAIVDLSAKGFLEELAERVEALKLQLHREIHLIAENDRNDARVVLPRECGGLGFDCQWNDDFHHALHACLTGERQGYYSDFGSIHDLAKAARDGYVYSGQYSKFRRRRQGSSYGKSSPEHFVVSAQNHDQVGNRAAGERLSQLVCFESLKLAAGFLLLSPFIPLLFMGEEYAEPAPFQYFVSHGDADLVERVRQGRREEFRDFDWQSEIPDPQSLQTFLDSKLHWELREHGKHNRLLSFYENLIQIRKQSPALCLGHQRESRVEVIEPAGLIVERWHDDDRVAVFFNFNDSAASFKTSLGGTWRKELDSSEQKWSGPGSSVPLNLGQQVSAIELQRRSFTLFRGFQAKQALSP